MANATRPQSPESSGVSMEFLDEQQYQITGILRYEYIFGKGYISTGGQEATDLVVKHVQLSPGSKILDVGCGIGGGTEFIARHYKSEAVGVDLSGNAINLALQRYKSVPYLQFRLQDALTADFKPESLDLFYSRDAILHLPVAQKKKLFKLAYNWLKPGGKVLITDYCTSIVDEWTDDFKKYIQQRQYTLVTVSEYKELIESAGFKNVTAQNLKEEWKNILQREVKKLVSEKDEFIERFSIQDYNDLKEGWDSKLKRVSEGIQTWGLFVATK